MKAYRVDKFGVALNLVEMATPEPQGTQVLLKTVACGVCHSDVHLHDGFFDLGGGAKLPLDDALPMVLGHEVMGEVVAVGGGVAAADAAVGDKRVIYPWIGCGECAVCRLGEDHLCLAPANIGIQKDGGFGDHVLVPHSRYLFDKGDVADEIAGSYGCSGLTSYSALKKLMPLLEGQQPVIVGAGGVGLMGLEIAKAAWGLAPIVADIDAGKRAKALELGASLAVDPTDPEAVAQVMEATGGGAVGVVDFVGAEASVGFGLSLLRKGGDLVLVGLFGGQLQYPLPLLALMERGIKGSYVGSLNNMRELMALVAAGKVKPIPYVTRKAEEATEVLDELAAGKVMGRAVLMHG